VSTDPAASEGAAHGGREDPSEEQLRAAYEEELSRITPADMMLQAVVSLLNIGARRLGLTGGEERAGAATPGAGGGGRGPADLEQVRDAIDGVRALLEVLERSAPGQLRQVRDALSQLQLAYAREASAGEGSKAGGGQAGGGQAPPGPGKDAPEGNEKAEGEDPRRAPGPAEASGRLWVPGR
jgi:hypothetical protein